MKLIYYTTAYYASHGGSIHSRHFFEESEKHPLINQVSIFPKQASFADRSDMSKKSWRTWIRSIPLLQILFFYRRNNFHLRNLIKTIKAEKPDAIVIRVDSNFLQIEKLRAMFPRLTLAAEINASPFDESFKNIAFRNFFRSLERKAYSLSDRNFFVSDHLRKKIMGASLNVERDLVVHNGVDTNIFKPQKNSHDVLKQWNIPPEDIVLGYIGTLDAHKRIDTLVQAFHVVAQTRKEVRLVIIGDGEDRQRLEALVAELKINDRVSFLRWQPHSTIPHLLSRFNIAIHHYASDYMSPLKLFEYMACKLPVIGPNTHAVKEIFTNGEHLCITDGTKEDIARQMERLISDKSAREAIAEGGYQLITQKFTWRHNADFIIRHLAQKTI